MFLSISKFSPPLFREPGDVVIIAFLTVFVKKKPPMRGRFVLINQRGGNIYEIG
jgi:hypothetical protein